MLRKRLMFRIWRSICGNLCVSVHIRRGRRLKRLAANSTAANTAVDAWQSGPLILATANAKHEPTIALEPNHTKALHILSTLHFYDPALLALAYP